MPSVLPAVLLASAAPAASVPAPAPLILDQDRSDRAPVAPLTAPAVQPSGACIAVEAQGRIVRISRVRFGHGAVPAGVARAAQAFVGKPATRATLGAMVKAMSDAYAHADVAL